jgi:hypothetical protein
MRDRVGAWLVGYFSVLGFQFQNWMPLAVGIVVIWIAFVWIGRHRRD